MECQREKREKARHDIIQDLLTLKDLYILLINLMGFMGLLLIFISHAILLWMLLKNFIYMCLFINAKKFDQFYKLLTKI